MSSRQKITVRQLVTLPALIGLLFFLLNDIFGLINGGGLFSLVSALRQANAGSMAIDVDRSALATIFVIVCAFTATSFGWFFEFPAKGHAAQYISIIAIVGMGFTLDVICGPSLIEGMMVHRGYIRCSAKDRSVGAGKGRVWLDAYVRLNRAC